MRRKMDHLKSSKKIDRGDITNKLKTEIPQRENYEILDFSCHIS